MSEKYKNTCKYVIYVEDLLISVSTVTGCVLISRFLSSVCVPVGITRSSVGINISATTAGIKTFKSIINNKKKNDKIVLFGKGELNNIEVLISMSITHILVMTNFFK